MAGLAQVGELVHQHVVEHPAGHLAERSLTRIVASAGVHDAQRVRIGRVQRTDAGRGQAPSGAIGSRWARARASARVAEVGVARAAARAAAGVRALQALRASRSTQCLSCARDIDAGMLTTTVAPSRWASTVRRRRALRRTSTSGRALVRGSGTAVG